MPIAKNDAGWVTLEQLELLTKQTDEVLLVHDGSIQYAGGKVADVQLKAGVLAVQMGRISIMGWDVDGVREWPTLNVEENWGKYHNYSRTIEGAVIRSIARGWGCSLEDILNESSIWLRDEFFEREVGTLVGKPFVEDVHIIRRPKAKVE